MSKMILAGWDSIGTARNGIPYGHVPGHHFHDVVVEISRKGDCIRVAIREQSGSAQGYDEVHSSETVVARGDALRDVVAWAKSLAIEADFPRDYLAASLSQAQDEAEEAVPAPSPAVAPPQGV